MSLARIALPALVATSLGACADYEMQRDILTGAMAGTTVGLAQAFIGEGDAVPNMARGAALGAAVGVARNVAEDVADAVYPPDRGYAEAGYRDPYNDGYGEPYGRDPYGQSYPDPYGRAPYYGQGYPPPYARSAAPYGYGGPVASAPSPYGYAAAPAYREPDYRIYGTRVPIGGQPVYAGRSYRY